MIKEPVIAIMLGLILIYEFLVLTRINSFVELSYTSFGTKSKADKSKLLIITMFNLFYMMFIIFGMCFGTQWKLYGLVFLLSIVSSPVIRYYKKKDNMPMITFVKIMDTLASIFLITKIFFNHFHG